ncbi:MAG: hypothetical protein OEZ31_11665 [Nitrospirota bacterium]|nr:hypothetical protein [Nitrospirota bacterium]
MKKLIKYLSLSLLLLSVSLSLSAEEYSCKEHNHILKRQSIGHEHVNHRLFLNGRILIKELADAMWFIETVTCTQKGFEIIASHVQYNEPTQKKFVLVIVDKEQYRVE